MGHACQTLRHLRRHWASSFIQHVLLTYDRLQQNPGDHVLVFSTTDLTLPPSLRRMAVLLSRAHERRSREKKRFLCPRPPLLLSSPNQNRHATQAITAKMPTHSNRHEYFTRGRDVLPYMGYIGSFASNVKKKLTKKNGVFCWLGPALLFFIFRFEYLISGPKSYRDFREMGPRDSSWLSNYPILSH